MNWRNRPKTQLARDNHRRAALIAMNNDSIRWTLKQKAVASWQNSDIRARRCAALREAWKRRTAEKVAA